MRAFHGDMAVKRRYVARLRAFEAADAILQWTGWNPERRTGGAVACTLERDDPVAYRTELGLPIWLAYLEEWIFDRMTAETSRTFPRLVLEAIPVGTDVDRAQAPFLAAVLSQLLTSKRVAPQPRYKAQIEETIAYVQHPAFGSFSWRHNAPSTLALPFRDIVRLRWDNGSAARMVSEAAAIWTETLNWAVWGNDGVVTEADRAGATSEADAIDRFWARLTRENEKVAYDGYANQLLTALRRVGL